MKQVTTPLRPGADYLPVALVKLNLESFARERGLSLEQGEDEFDAYSLLQLRSENGYQFLLLHYAGADKNTFDIWLPTDVESVGQSLSMIVAELSVPSATIVQRTLSDNAFKPRTLI